MDKKRFEVIGQGNFVLIGMGRRNVQTRDIVVAEGEDQINWARDCPILKEIRKRGKQDGNIR